MTERERIMAVAAGESVSPKPSLSWPDSEGGRSGDFRLTLILNPVGKALAEGVDLNDAQRRDPIEGAMQLDRYADMVRSEIEEARKGNEGGILYSLHGADPAVCTPMEYGGFYLERDRELLGLAASTFTVLFVAGTSEAYFDCVSDLPAAAFAWDSERTGMSAKKMRVLRRGALASADPESELILTGIQKSYGLEERQTIHV